jgi:MobA/MobL family
MAIYHLSTNVHSRGKGHSAVAAAAYRSGEKLYDERIGETYNWQTYRKSHGEVLASEIFLPSGADDKYLDRSFLWNGAESAEKTKAGAYKKTSAIAREIECSLPAEMNDRQRAELAKRHAAFLVQRYGVAVDMNIHAPHPEGSEKNYHVHFLLTTRELDQNEFGNKGELELDGKTKKKMGFANGKDQIKEMRENWANDLNTEMQRGGFSERVDHRSFEDSNIQKLPSKHMGAAATEMERKGQQTNKGDLNRDIENQNKQLENLEFQQSVIDEAIEREEQKQTHVKNRAAYDRKQERDQRLNDIDESRARAAKRAKNEQIRQDKNKQQAHERTKLEALFESQAKLAANNAHKPPEMSPVVWDRDKADREFQESIINAAIEREKQKIELEKQQKRDIKKYHWQEEKREKQQIINNYKSVAEELDQKRKIEAQEQIEKDRIEHLYGAHNRALNIEPPAPEKQSPEKLKNITSEFEKNNPSNDNKNKEKSRDKGRDYGGFER